jgi:hypothetical protein
VFIRCFYRASFVSESRNWNNDCGIVTVRGRNEGRVRVWSAMGERQNTLVCTFDPQSPRISAFEIHEWIHEQLRVDETAVTMVQIDGPRRQIYINFVDLRYV